MNIIQKVYVVVVIISTVLATGCFKSSTEDLKPQSYPVDTRASHGGTIEPAELIVETGNSTNFTVLPLPGFSVDTVSGCDGSLSGDVYSTGPINNSCIVVAEFISSIGETYQVNARSASGTTRGTISPPKVSVREADRGYFYIDHNPGFIPVVTGCGGNLVGDIYTTAPTTTDCTIEAVFEPISGDLHQITAIAGIGGSIAPHMLSVPAGEPATFQVTPGRGFEAEVSGCDGTLEDNLYTIDSVNADCVIDAQFFNIVPDSHLVNAYIEEGGVISPSFVSIQDGAIITFEIETDIDRAVDNITGCPGTYYEDAGLFTTSPIREDCDVDVTLGVSTPPSYQVGVMIQGFGQATPEKVNVQSGSRAQIALTPDLGYRVASATGCGGQLSGDIYTTGPIDQPCTIQVIFEDALSETFDVTTYAGPGGSISPSVVQVAAGAPTGFTITPDSGYEINNVSGCSGQRDGNTYTTGLISESCQVSVTFSRVYTVSTAMTGGGRLSPASMTVKPGHDAIFHVLPDDGNLVESISGCGGSFGGVFDMRYIINSVNSDCQVAVVFSGKPRFSGIIEGSGSISPDSVIGEWAEDIPFTLTPDNGWWLDSVQGCWGYREGHDTYIVQNVGYSCEFVAVFKEHTRDVPTNLQLTPNGTGRIDYSFDEVDGATGYNLYLGVGYAPSPSQYSSRFTNATGGWIYNMTPGLTMYFMMTAYYGDNNPDTQESGPSEAVSAVVPY